MKTSYTPTSRRTGLAALPSCSNGNHGLISNRKAVQRHMREMGIAGISPGPNLSRSNLEHRIYPYLLRGVTAAYPNHAWAIDITNDAPAA